jgi:hypothetical protein
MYRLGVGPAAGCGERCAASILRHKTSTTADPILSHFNSNSELSTGWERNRAFHSFCRCDLGVASAYEAVRDTLSTRKRGLPGGVGDNLAMDALQIELAKLRRDANLTQSIHDVDKIIKQLENARESIVSGMEAFLSSLRWGAKSAGVRPLDTRLCLYFALALLLTLYISRRSEFSFYYACEASKSPQKWLR